MIKSISAITKYKNGISKLKATDKLSIKSIILPDVHESDDSTINFTKRVGGEMIQCYSLSEVKLKQPDICIPTFKEVIFTPCRASSIWVDVPCEPSIFDFEVELPKDFDFSFTTRNTTVIPEYDYETGTYIPGEFPTTPLTLSLTLKDIEGFWSLKRNNELLYSSEQMPPLDTNKEIYEGGGGDFDYDIKFSLDIGEGPVGAVNVYEFKGKVSELGILTRNNAVATGELEITRYDSINIPKYRFTTINVDLILPDYFPNHITTAKHMFFNSSIKGSSLSSWDVSNVMNMSGMFSEVNFKNNVDLSSWVTTKVIDMSSMFNGAFNFNKDISGWDVSNVTNMEYMFSGATAFNQDLSQWCVELIPTLPSDFDTNTPSWTLPKPVWGECPNKVEPTNTNFVFSVQDIASEGVEFEVWMSKGIIDPGEVVSTEPWELINLNTGETVASSEGYIAPDYVVRNISHSLSIAITIPITASPVRYEFIGTGSYAGFGYYSDNHPDAEYPPAIDDFDIDPEIKVVVESFSTTIPSYEFYVDYADLTVPKILPAHITDCGYMFADCFLFNQDLSTWDTVNVTNMDNMFAESRFNQDISMWDVSNVTSMERMFSQNYIFNQDLSGWCVTKIPTKPENFDYDATSWTLPKPVWGTCPSEGGGDGEPNGDPNDLGVSDLGEPYVFSTTNVATPASELMLSIDMYNYTKWQLVDTDTGLVIANSRGYFAPDIQDNQSQSNAASVQLRRSKTGVSNYALYVKADSVTFSNQGSGDTVVGTFSLTQWGTMSPNPRFMLNGVTTTVPDTLSESVTSADLMFASNNLFNQDISGWETGHLVSATRMFEGASKFNQDINMWDVSNVTNMSGMFSLAYAFNQPLNSWDVSNVTDMTHMFSNTEFDQPLDSWDVSNVTNMDSMFAQSNMSHDLSGWCVTNIPSYPQSFASFSPLRDMPEFHPQWGTCPRGEDGSGGAPENQIASITINGEAKVGGMLFAEVADSNGVPININFQWYADGELISDATSETYVLKNAEAGKAITVKAEFTDNDGYAESVTSAATEVVQPAEIVDEGVNVKDFDFAVVKYQWSDAGGTDLDTRTWISSPDRSEHKVGWSRVSEDLNYLQWNEDNTGSGVESVLIDMKSIQQDYPNQRDIAIKMAAFWFSSVSSGDVRLQFSLFKGGTMKAGSDFDWVNEGGREVQNITLSANTQMQTSEDVNGQLLATLKVNTDTGAGSLTNPDGVIGVNNPVLPEIVPTGLPLKFSTENWRATGELPIKLQLINPIGDWFLVVQGLPVASFDGILGEGITSTSSDNGITLLLNNTYQDIMDYELLGQFESVTLSSGELGATGEVSVTQFGEKVGSHLFSLTDIDLNVPTQLPASITSTNKMFSGSNVFAQDLTTWDVSNVVDMSYMFEGCTDFDALIGGWNVSNVTNMEGLFKDCDSFNTDISSWNTAAVTNMSYMFNKAYDFAGDTSNWDVSNVTNMAHMFEGTGYFNQDISTWNVSNVTNMDYMFNLAEEFNQDLSQWCVIKIPTAPVKFDATPYWTEAKPVWGTCPEKAPVVPEPVGEVFTFSAYNDSGDIAPIEVQVQDAVGDWAIREDGTVIATSGGYINNKFTLTSDDTSSYVTIPITEEVAKSYEVIGKMGEVKLSHKILNNSYVTVEILSFGERVNSHKFNLPQTDLTVPNTLPSHVKTTQYMFQNCEEFDQDLSTWDVSNVTNMQGMFKDCEYFNQDISLWNTSAVVDMSYMFEGCIAFDMPLNTWNVSNVTNMQGMFKGCEDFNGNISSWNVSNVIDMSYMFEGCPYFNIALSNWKPLNVVNMSHMFDGCEEFDQLISQWKTPKAEDMSYMFNNCYVYNRAMSAWNVSNVTNMQGMFKECYLFNKTLALWNVSNVTDMSRMFEWCESYNQDLSAWKPTKIPTKPVDFDKNASAWTRAKPTWGG